MKRIALATVLLFTAAGTATAAPGHSNGYGARGAHKVVVKYVVAKKVAKHNRFKKAKKYRRVLVPKRRVRARILRKKAIQRHIAVKRLKRARKAVRRLH